jgi:hypothetical protein
VSSTSSEDLYEQVLTYVEDLKYCLLEYHYSNAAVLQEWDKRLMGISMDIPATYLNATQTFTPPKPVLAEESEQPRSGETSFLWQAPNSNAILFMGSKWMELHGFVSEVLEVQREAGSMPAMLANKAVSTKFPSWLEHALQLSRARGYFTLYPSPDTASTVATVHHELYQPPEEYGKSAKATSSGEKKNHDEIILSHFNSLLDTLPYNGVLMPFNELPLLSWDGKLTTLPQMDGWSREYAIQFRREVGGCEGKDVQSMRMDGSARDLFCKKTQKSR